MRKRNLPNHQFFFKKIIFFLLTIYKRKCQAYEKMMDYEIKINRINGAIEMLDEKEAYY